MAGRLAGKVAFIAGASAGIGRSTAKLFAAEGAVVIAAARSGDKLEALAKEIAAEGGKAHPLVLDISDIGAYVAALRDAAKAHGRLDCFVHNAMYGHFRPLADVTLEDWRMNFQVNADAAFMANQEAVRIMGAQGGGSIVNIATIASLRITFGLGAYAASKMALIQMSQQLAIEAAPAKVRVNVVVPGVIDTETMRGSFGNDPNIAQAAAQSIPMKRFGRPEELAAGVLFLASDEASYITGQSLIIDGGRYVQS